MYEEWRQVCIVLARSELGMTEASLIRCEANPMAPQIPHMASACGIQEGAAGTAQLGAEMRARDAEAVFAEPAQGDAGEGRGK